MPNSTIGPVFLTILIVLISSDTANATLGLKAERPSVIYVNIGKNKSLSCPLEAEKAPEVEWFSKNQPLEDYKDGTLKVPTYGMPQIEIIHATLKHAGTYQCKYDGKTGYVKLIVTLVEFMDKKKDYKVVEGSDFSHPCGSKDLGDTDSKPVRGKVEKLIPGSMFDFQPPFHVTLKNVQRTLSPKSFTCKSQDNSVEADITIDVQYKPDIAAPEKIINIFKGTDIDIVCTVTGANPKVEINKVNLRFAPEDFDGIEAGTKLTKYNNVSKTVTLEIKNITAVPLNPLTCTATNEIGNRRMEFKLKLIEEPPKPHQVKVSVQGTDVKLKIIHNPANDTPETSTGYIAKVTKAGEKDPTIYVLSEPNMNDCCTLTNLQPLTGYSAVFAIQNVGGNSSKFSDEVTFKTGAVSTASAVRTRFVIALTCPILLVHLLRFV